MKIPLKLLFGIIFISIQLCQSANILGIFHHPGKSHHKLGEVLLLALAAKGHNVTMVSPYPLKEKVDNYREIVPHEIMDDMEDRIKNDWFQKFSDNSASSNTYMMLLNMTLTQSELLFRNKEFQGLISSGEHFDVIIMDWLFNESHLVFGKLFNCPIILSASFGTSYNVNYLVGNVAPYSYVPFKFFPLTENMTFMQRVLNTVLHIGSEYYNTYFHSKKHQEILDKYVPDPPKLSELFKHVALILSNGHFSFESKRPVVPNIIEVGGFHVEKPKPLKGDLKEFLDSAKDGFIYFSLGSNMKSTFLDKTKQEEILKAFSKVPIKVLWKFETDIPNKPANVKISKWLPQNDVLAHPNIKLFITHGGLLSTIESIYHGVPMIGIPMFGDQNSNVPTGVENGYALQIKPTEISEAIFLDSITEMLNNPTYSMKAKLHSDLLKNQPIDPLQRSIYWVERVIKYRGADYLKNKSVNLPWYQYMLIDVILFLSALIIGAMLIAYFTLKFLYSCIRRKCKKTEESRKKKKVA